MTPSFGQFTDNHFASSAVRNLNSPSDNKVTDVVILDVNVLRPRVILWVLNQYRSALPVAIYSYRLFLTF